MEKRVENWLRPEEPGLLFRTDAGHGDLLGRPGGDRLFGGQRRAHPHACRRADLCGRRHGEITEIGQALRLSFRSLGGT